jgi:hypothetical protein
MYFIDQLCVILQSSTTIFYLYLFRMSSKTLSTLTSFRRPDHQVQVNRKWEFKGNKDDAPILHIDMIFIDAVVSNRPSKYMCHFTGLVPPTSILFIPREICLAASNRWERERALWIGNPRGDRAHPAKLSAVRVVDDCCECRLWCGGRHRCCSW